MYHDLHSHLQSAKYACSEVSATIATPSFTKSAMSQQQDPPKVSHDRGRPSSSGPSSFPVLPLSLIDFPDLTLPSPTSLAASQTPSAAPRTEEGHAPSGGGNVDADSTTHAHNETGRQDVEHEGAYSTGVTGVSMWGFFKLCWRMVKIAWQTRQNREQSGEEVRWESAMCD